MLYVLFSQNYFFSDSQIVKFLIGGGLKKNETLVDEKSDNDKIGSVFDSLGLIRRNDPSQQNNKNENLYGGNGEIKNTDSQHLEELTVFSLKVRPALMNFLGRLHGGALAMSIEEAIRTRFHSHHKASKITDHDILENDSDRKDGGKTKNVDVIGNKEINRSKIGRNMNHLDKISDPQESTIVRMEVTYKSSMTSELDITCKDDVHSISTYTPEQYTSTNSNKKFRIHNRRTVGEVFNHRDKNNKDKSKDSKIDSGGDTYIGPSATYTCYWSGTS